MNPFSKFAVRKLIMSCRSIYHWWWQLPLWCILVFASYSCLRCQLPAHNAYISCAKRVRKGFGYLVLTVFDIGSDLVFYWSFDWHNYEWIRMVSLGVIILYPVVMICISAFVMYRRPHDLDPVDLDRHPLLPLWVYLGVAKFYLNSDDAIRNRRYHKSLASWALFGVFLEDIAQAVIVRETCGLEGFVGKVSFAISIISICWVLLHRCFIDVFSAKCSV